MADTCGSGGLGGGATQLDDLWKEFEIFYEKFFRLTRPHKRDFTCSRQLMYDTHFDFEMDLHWFKENLAGQND